MVPEKSQPHCGGWRYRGDLWRYLGRNYYQGFFLILIVYLGRFIIGTELFFYKVEVEDDTVEDDFSHIGKNQPQIEDALCGHLVI